jgi:hypothetical protein
MFASGTVTDTSATLAPAYVLDLPADAAPTMTGEFVLELRDEDGAVLTTRSFDLLGHTAHPGTEGPRAFVQLVPYDPSARSLVLRRGDQILASRTASASAPAVNILTPVEGAHWEGARTVSWEASDADGDDLTFGVDYSTDNGRSWVPVAAGLTGTTFDLDADSLQGSRDCLVRVIATDGFNSTVAISGVFGVEPHLPRVAITSPPVALPNGQAILYGDGYDVDEGGSLPDERLVWTSDRDGVLGTGQVLATTPLAPGPHVITLTVTDSDGNVASATASLNVVIPPPEPPE